MALSLGRTARDLGAEVSRSYAQVLFSRSVVVGTLLIAATLLVPRVAVGGLLAAATSALVVRVLRLPPLDAAEGVYGYNPVLVGLGVAAAFSTGGRSLALVVLAAFGAVVLTAAARATVGARWGLPVLTLPFLAGLWLSLAAGSGVGLARAEAVVDPFVVAGPLDAVLRALRGLGMLFFVPRADAGLLVAAALVAWSRHGALLAVGGLAVAGVVGAVWLSPAAAGLQLALALNLALTAVALGGVWFVPGKAASALGLGGAALAGLVTLGLAPVLGFLDLPVAVLPFNLATLGVLLAMRLRQEDRAPKAVDFLLGTPEQHLHHFRTRVARFGARYTTRLNAPFLGPWTVTQGEHGAHTHRGAWWSAADFEVQGEDGRRYGGTGERLPDWHCYKLPVVAPADGTVVATVDGLPDNAPGHEDLDHPWGNLVVLWVGPALYVLLGHLSPGTLDVREGQVVRRGDVLARCGSSGRAPAPHLHVQLQAVGSPGAATLPIELHDVVDLSTTPPRLRSAVTPVEGHAYRNVHVEDDVASRFRFDPTRPLSFRMDDGTVETLWATVDLYGQRSLVSRQTGARLPYVLDKRVFTVLDSLGPRHSVVRLVHRALPRVPFEVTDGLVWSDHLPARELLRGAVRFVVDAVRPYLPDDAFEVVYEARREGDRVVIVGRSVRTRNDGTPWLESRTELARGPGIALVQVTLGGRTWRAVAVEAS